MILGVNGIRLVHSHSGVARAIEAILDQFGRMSHPFDDIRIYTPQPLGPEIRLPADCRNVVVRSPLPPSLWEQIALPLAHPRNAVLFCPSYTLPLLATCPTLLIHHGSYEGYADRSQVFGLWRRIKARVGYELSARRATIVSTVSDYSRRDMGKFYRMAPDRIHVIPEGVDTQVFRPIDDASELSRWRIRMLGSDEPFLLYVGKPTRRRNLPNLLTAFQRLKAQLRLPHKLVLIGTALPGTSFARQIEALGLCDHVVSIPHASHREIALAYNACSVFLYPSSYEGFGMPVLEAMACGAPVITLNNTAFPEFAQGVATLLPDAEVSTLQNAIVDILSNESLRNHMRQRGPERAANYDWTLVARRYLDLLLELAAPGLAMTDRSA